VLLQARLNSTVIAQIPAAETRGIARAGILLLRRALMLRESKRHVGEQKRHGNRQPDHHKNSLQKETATRYKGKLREKRAAPAKVPPCLEPGNLPQLAARGDLQFEQRHPLQDRRVALAALRRAQDGFRKQIDLGR
jgi:hypothetical protein